MSSKKTVSFSTIEIIEFPITLGDNPSVSSGAPLTIEWTPQDRCQFELDVFEKYRPRRRHSSRLAIAPHIREEVLLAHGFGLDEILFWQETPSKKGVVEGKTKKTSPFAKLFKKARKLSPVSRQRQAVRPEQPRRKACSNHYHENCIRNSLAIPI
mmetsp:Transcript_117183/g.164834  ORF Transcript_117183/g.164834 Transcript_117183/m.164834 type:complete len:155 (+) Transcript_117183:28-492(+)